MGIRDHKYNLKPAELKHVYVIADMTMGGRYHDMFKQVGLRQGASGNFHCPNAAAHGKGDDKHPSVSIKNDTGQWHCFACGIKGNFNTYFKEYLANTGTYGDSYTDFIIDLLGIASQVVVPTDIGADYEERSAGVRELAAKMKNEYKAKSGREYAISKENDEARKDDQHLPKDDLAKYTEALLGHKDAMDYMWSQRHINETVIKKHMLGLMETQYGDRIVFPQIDAEGNFINMKSYSPYAKKEYKWQYPHKGRKTIPTPMSNFMGQKIYFFEGEPDCYCAIGFGLNGVTMGPCGVTDVDKVFGTEMAKLLFTGKECVIVFDVDEPGRTGATKLAHSLYPYAKQIKILNLQMRDGVPYGLPLETKTVDDKEVLIYKDMTDFMVKINGNGDDALVRFRQLENDTKAYTENTGRRRQEFYKVTIQEARQPRYCSSDGTIELELIASVAQFDSRAFLYPSRVRVSCPCASDIKKQTGQCNKCSMPSRYLGAGGSNEFFDIDLVRSVDLETSLKPNEVRVTEHSILGLIQVPEYQKDAQLMKLLKVNHLCKDVTLMEVANEKLLQVVLVRDINEAQTREAGASDIDIEAYMLGERDIYANKSYRFKGVSTTAWGSQHVVLFLHAAEPIATSIESFKVTEEVQSVLMSLQPRDGDTIEGQTEHLARRYDILSDILGISGRNDLIYVNDLAYFSAAEIDNTTLLPQIHRGFVEVDIIGDTRCGKTVVTKGLHKLYGIGEMLESASAVSRSGLLGGVQHNKKTGRSTISWGKIPMNDRGLVAIDEMSNLHVDTIRAMTGARSAGSVNIDMIVTGKAPARTRKIMISNDRDPAAQMSESRGLEGVPFLLSGCCGIPEVLSRFDVAMIVRRDDVPFDEFKASYNRRTTDLTEYQCRIHIMWTYSRTPEDLQFEDGLEQHLTDAMNRMLVKYHPSTQLVNQEMRAKLLRLAIAHATILVSTNDFQHILVKKSHVEYVEKFLDKLYSSKNMQLDIFSRMQRQSEHLGDMKFMMNILKYVNIYMVMNMDDVSEVAVLHVFHDYISRVAEGSLRIPDAMNDDNLTSGKSVTINRMRDIDITHKLVSIMAARNCIVRVKNRYRKTSMFNQWLKGRLELGARAETSDILEHNPDKQAGSLREDLKRLDRLDKDSEEGRVAG